MVFSYYISCVLPYLIAGLGIIKYGWHSDNEGGILSFVIAALIVSLINAVWGLILLPRAYLNRSQFNRITAALVIGGICPIVIAILVSIFTR